MLDDKQNVTFKAFFKFSTLMLTGTMLYVTTITPTVYGRNYIIVSLFLMLSMAFAYVIILYIAYGRLSLHEPKSAKKQKNVIIALIYEGRMAAKAGILTFIVAEAARGTGAAEIWGDCRCSASTAGCCVYRTSGTQGSCEVFRGCVLVHGNIGRDSSGYEPQKC
ncbi:MAG: hypothetical protein ACLVH0_05585 [Coprococcus eutactus]